MSTATIQKIPAAELYPGGRRYAALPHPDALDDSAIERYHRDGFIAINNVFTSDEVAGAIAGLGDLLRASVAGDGVAVKGVKGPTIDFEAVEFDRSAPIDELERYVRKFMWFTGHDARLGAFASHPRLLGIVRRLMGGEPQMIQDMALLKPPGVGREKPWHQDAAYFLYEPRDRIVGTWTALDEAREENGCMHAIPGSHLAGAQAHYHERDCQLPDDVIETAKDVTVPLLPGGVMFFSALVHHGTPPNRSNLRRRAIQLHYAPADATKIDMTEHSKIWADGKGYSGCANFIDGTPKRTLADRF